MNAWLKEDHTGGYSVNWKITDILWHEKTPYQELAVVETVDFGRALILDGILQTTIGDEFIYHEMMSHVAMHVHPNPTRVLIIGGGDGGILREVLKHDSVRNVDLVEIDRRVVEVSREYLPEIACGFDDPRARVFFDDGINYVKDRSSEYDVVIVDSSDPIGPSTHLFTEEFYSDVNNILTFEGIMVAQAESPFFFSRDCRRVYRNMRNIFPISKIYLACVPTYISGFWAFALGSKKHDPLTLNRNQEISGLKYYSRDIHRAAFVLPPFVRDLLEG